MNVVYNSSKIVVFIGLVLLLCPRESPAQYSANPDSALQTILQQLAGTRISLAQAEQSAAQYATNVRTSEAVYMASEGSVRREEGSYDPVVYFNMNRLDNRQPSSSFFTGAPILATQQTASNGGISLNLPVGTHIEADLVTSRLTTNSTFAALNPELDATGSLTVRQPLLGGFAASARKKLNNAEAQRDAEKSRYDQQVLAARGDVERLYWDLYAAERDYAVQKLTRDRAEAFLKETLLRAQTGLVGSDQVASARTSLAQQELALIDRDEQLGAQSDQLAAYIGLRPDAPESRYVPADTPATTYTLEPVEVLVDRAQKNNRDLLAAQKDIDAASALSDAATWEALPSVDLIGSFGGNAILGTSQLVNIPGLVSYTVPGGTFGDALNQVLKRDYPSWSLGVAVNIPVGFRSGLGEKDRLDAGVLSAQQHKVELSRALDQQVRAAYRELAHGTARLKAAREGVDAAQEQVRIGLIEFRAGRQTAFQLVRLAEDLADAERQYSAALVRTAKASSTLHQLTAWDSTTTDIH
ncbi:MAG TPA: TolC family protein [Bacteroidota bacterium]|nr:TolC family protein [Bacteroidota bacterium]